MGQTLVCRHAMMGLIVLNFRVRNGLNIVQAGHVQLAGRILTQLQARHVSTGRRANPL